MCVFFSIFVCVKKEKKIHPSARRKVINKSGLQQVTDQIKTLISEKNHSWGIVLDYSNKPLMNGNTLTLQAHTKGKLVKCPCCGKRTKTVHSYVYRKLQCTELLNNHVVLSLKVRHMKCRNPECEKNIFVEPLSFARPYARHTDSVEEQIRHEALCQTAGKAARPLSRHNIKISPSSVTRRLHVMGKDNPDIRTSGYVGLDDFAKKKGYKYMCVIADHYTRQPLAVFDSRYGQEITDWLKAHPEIKTVTRDGSQVYESIIREASEHIVQVSDRFHLMQALKKNVVEPIKAMLGQKRERRPYPYPSEDEAYKYIMNDISEIGEARHRNRVKFYYEVRHLKDEGNSIAETARILGVKSQKVHRILNTDISKILNAEQKCAAKAARDIARVVSSGAVTKGSVMKRMKVSISSRTLCKCLKSVTAQYKPLRDEVRRYNKTLEERKKIPKVKADTIWHYIVHGETDSKKLQKTHETHPEVDRVMNICMNFRKMLHGDENAYTIDEWLKEAESCPLKEIRGFARYIRKDRNAVEQACQTSFSNALLEGTVNKAKAIKRSMFNRAGPDVLRAKLLYSNSFGGEFYHLN